MTKQEIFNGVWKYFVVEKHPRAYNEEKGVCEYLTPNGNKCAVGCLLEGELSEQARECTNKVTSLLKYNHAIREFLGYENLDFLIRIQDIHDQWIETGNGNFTDYMKSKLTSVSNFHYLEIPS